jgi:hypothetical protein
MADDNMMYDDEYEMLNKTLALEQYKIEIFKRYF